MYRDPYRDEYDRETSRYSRDPYYEDRPRERSYDDRERLRLPPPLLDDPYYRRLDDLDTRSYSRSLRDPPLEPGAEMHGSAVLIPLSPFEPRPKKREKPANCDTVFIGSLPDQCTEKHLDDIFSNCGKIAEIRISRGRNFGHVQFAVIDDSVDKAVELSGCKLRVGPTSSHSDVSRIHVDFAQPRGEPELLRRLKEDEVLTFNTQNATTISSDLHHDDAFGFGAKNVIHWLERGSCTQSTSNTFFTLIGAANTHGRKLHKTMKTREDETSDAQTKFLDFLEKLKEDCAVLGEVFVAASQQKAWDTFTKPQRKTLAMWKDFATDFHGQVLKSIDEGGKVVVEAEPPEAKRVKVDSDSVLEADLERCNKEVEQLRVDHEVAMEKKDREILQLKTLLARFKAACPDEWEKAIGTPAKPKEAKPKPMPSIRGRGRRAKRPAPVPSGDEEEKVEQAPAKEVIEGVPMDDLNDALEKGIDTGGENSLAAAAAAYAQARSAIGSTEAAGLNLTELEVAVVSVIATFLTVHPLGASMEEISSYLQTFNPTLTAIYVDALVRRLPQVFQLSQSAEGKAKWWFSGFNSCCNQAQYGTGASAKEDSATSSNSTSKS